jgi:hypothetical protein
MVFVIVGAVAGATLALCRYPFILLAPIAGLLAACTLLLGGAHGIHPAVLLVQVLGSFAAPQLMYIAVGLTADLARAPGVMRQVQEAIGKELRVELDVPRHMPGRIGDPVRRLQRG